MKKYILSALVVAATMSVAAVGFAEESTMEKVGTTGNKTMDSVKKTGRAASDKACEMVDGKMKCAGKKMKHKMQNAKDATGTKVEEVKNQVD